MPRYTYKCSVCEQAFDVVHSMSEEYTNCKDVECDEDKVEVLSKVPSTLNFYRKKEPNHKTGDIVKSSIEEFRKDLKEQKKSLSESEYGN